MLKNDCDFSEIIVPTPEDIIKEVDNKPSETSDMMDAQEAIYKLKDYLLGENWYIVDPVSCKQGNAIIVDEILRKYSRRYLKEQRIKAINEIKMQRYQRKIDKIKNGGSSK